VNAKLVRARVRVAAVKASEERTCVVRNRNPADFMICR
jgi:hypothetical protein